MRGHMYMPCGSCRAASKAVARTRRAFLNSPTCSALRWSRIMTPGWVQHITRKFETEIGADLQHVRLKGAIVGGLVGLMAHAVS